MSSNEVIDELKCQDTVVDVLDDAPFPAEFETPDRPLEMFSAVELKPSHDSEPALFARHEGIPAHDQTLLQSARIVLVGAGGLNGWLAVGLARSGATLMTIIDHDRASLSNLPRQFFFSDDLGQLKGVRLAKHAADHAVAGGTFVGIGLPFNQAIESYPLPADILVVGVDSNECRLQAAREARRRRIPAVFTMLSLDGMRFVVFSQGPSPQDPCLWCALPNLDPETVTPCAAAIISGCFMASAFTLFFVHRAIMGWGKLLSFNWREADLTGISQDRTGIVKKRDNCWVCSEGVKAIEVK